ncbi:hypothetical protein [Desulfitobacterium hafniense]|uniref:hypothetical protein n=1 Tax=Desulfitobacterium hafniense TaxID=49338 RepID=UPI00031AA23D|nr:hypothetical protein [Desulfitobacterium hafniense]
MYEGLKTKVKSIAEKYADLVDKRISTALQSELVDATVMNEITDGVRMLAHVTTTLEKVDRLSRGNGTDGQE